MRWSACSPWLVCGECFVLGLCLFSSGDSWFLPGPFIGQIQYSLSFCFSEKATASTTREFHNWNSWNTRDGRVLSKFPRIANLKTLTKNTRSRSSPVVNFLDLFFQCCLFVFFRFPSWIRSSLHRGHCDFAFGGQNVLPLEYSESSAEFEYLSRV